MRTGISTASRDVGIFALFPDICCGCTIVLWGKEPLPAKGLRRLGDEIPWEDVVEVPTKLILNSKLHQPKEIKKIYHLSATQSSLPSTKVLLTMAFGVPFSRTTLAFLLPTNYQPSRGNPPAYATEPPRENVICRAWLSLRQSSAYIADPYLSQSQHELLL